MGKAWKKRLIILASVLILISVGGFFALRMIDANGGDDKYRKLKIERGEIASAVTATGTINPVVNVLVGSQASGTIKALYADFNSQVKEGQVIAQIDPAIFEAQVDQGRANLLNAQANLLNIQANLTNAQANLAKAEVAVLDTKRTLDRNKELAERKVVAQATLDTTQANYDSAIAQRDSNKAQIESAKAQIEQAKAQIAQARASLKVSETNLRYTTIRSPVNGTVISRNVDVGQTVAASLQAPTLFTIAKDLTQMQVDSNISEADVGRIAVGQDATFTVDAYAEMTFRGRVSEIRNAPTTIQNVVTYDVVIKVDNKELKLKPGMTANVSVLIAHKEGVLKIPNSALRFQPQSVAKEQGPEKQKAASSSGGGGQRPIERLTKELNLTDEQRSKAEMVLASARQEIQEIREKSKPEDARPKIQNLIKQKIWGILTDEQKRKLAEMGQGSSSSQGEERRPAKVWVLSPEGKPAAVSILLGITNGTYSEVAGGDLKEGTEVIVEELSKKKTAQGPSSPPGIRGFGR
jgi:HlyD family secretion protein